MDTWNTLASGTRLWRWALLVDLVLVVAAILCEIGVEDVGTRRAAHGAIAVGLTLTSLQRVIAGLRWRQGPPVEGLQSLGTAYAWLAALRLGAVIALWLWPMHALLKIMLFLALGALSLATMLIALIIQRLGALATGSDQGAAITRLIWTLPPLVVAGVVFVAMPTLLAVWAVGALLWVVRAWGVCGALAPAYEQHATQGGPS